MHLSSQLSSAIKELLRSELTYVLRIYLLHKLWITPLRDNGFDEETEEVGADLPSL